MLPLSSCLQQVEDVDDGTSGVLHDTQSHPSLIQKKFIKKYH